MSLCLHLLYLHRSELSYRAQLSSLCLYTCMIFICLLSEVFFSFPSFSLSLSMSFSLTTSSLSFLFAPGSLFFQTFFHVLFLVSHISIYFRNHHVARHVPLLKSYAPALSTAHYHRHFIKITRKKSRTDTNILTVVAEELKLRWLRPMTLTFANRHVKKIEKMPFI